LRPGLVFKRIVALVLHVSKKRVVFVLRKPNTAQ
jgi:hypothetical protein